MLEIAYGVSTALFAFVLVFFCLASPPGLFSEIWVAAGLVFLIHILRWALDYWEAKVRGTPVRTMRQARDAGANLAIIVCALAAGATKEPRLAHCAVVLSAMLILREVKFRTVDEVVVRLNPAKAQPAAIDTASVPFPLVVAQVFIGKFVKSMTYIGIGFALLFQNLALIDASPASFIIRPESSSHNEFVDYLYFSLGMINHNAYGDVTPVSVAAKTLAGFEQVISSVLLTVVVAMLIESINARFREPEPPRARAAAKPPTATKTKRK